GSSGLLYLLSLRAFRYLGLQPEVNADCIIAKKKGRLKRRPFVTPGSGFVYPILETVLDLALPLLGLTLALLNTPFGAGAGFAACLFDSTGNYLRLVFGAAHDSASSLSVAENLTRRGAKCCIYSADHFTSSTGTGTSCTTRVATEPITRLPRLPMPRVPMTTVLQPSRLTAATTSVTTSPTATWLWRLMPACSSSSAASRLTFSACWMAPLRRSSSMLAGT